LQVQKSKGDGLEIGIDIIDISRFDRYIISRRNILEKIFTRMEIQYCEKKLHAAQHYSVRFAGKEAVVKAFLCYGIRIPLNKIEILNKKNGSPFVTILDKNVDNFEIKISLSHSDKTAVAVAVVYKKSKDKKNYQTDP
jgi:phosphopantetheine--protein transferase-like protein